MAETGETSAKPTPLQPVDELTLVTLMSAVPGIDRELAESAVRATGSDVEAAGSYVEAGGRYVSAAMLFSVEAALLWLTLATKEEVATLVPKEEVATLVTKETRGSPEGGTRTERELENERWEEAEELLHRELGNSLRNKTDLTEEHLGLPLHEEKELIDHYLVLALSQVAGPAAASGPAGGGGR